MRIGIFGSEYQIEKQSLIRRLFEKLQLIEAEIFVEKKFNRFLTEVVDYTPPIQGILPDKDFPLDLALSLGGDGTFLRTAVWVNRQHIPILGINTGRLGFLADVSNTELENTLDEIFRHYYRVEERTLLHLTSQEHDFRGYPFALNEIALLKRDTSSMITLHTYLNDEYLTSYQADGLVIATPTGSTAYSMSVNGPIIVPQNRSIVLSPVAPHSLNVRPLVIPDDCRLSLTVESRSRSFLVALDGRSEIFPSGIQVQVERADYTIQVVKRFHHTFYQTLREKLMWGADKRLLSIDQRLLNPDNNPLKSYHTND
ncbi:MAG: NAD kinase [Parabacteroides sp.]